MFQLTIKFLSSCSIDVVDTGESFFVLVLRLLFYDAFCFLKHIIEILKSYFSEIVIIQCFDLLSLHLHDLLALDLDDVLDDVLLCVDFL